MAEPAGERVEAEGRDSSSPRTSGPEGSPELGPIWTKIEILGRPVSAFVTAVVVAALGFWGQGYLSTRELELTRRAAIEQDTRLYSEIMSRREQSESSLRKEMFNAILSKILVSDGSGDAASSAAARGVDLLRVAETRLLKLELLALNFGDSLSLSPLFLQLEREIESIAIDESQPFARESRDELLERLRSLARRISSAQLAALSSVGETIRFQIPFGEVSAGKVYEWPSDFVKTTRKDLEEDEEWEIREKGIKETLELGDVERTYNFTFKHADDEDASILVDLVINVKEQEAVGNPEATDAEVTKAPMPPTEMSFELNFFNFPLIDNTRLSGDQRFALVMERFEVEGDPKQGAIQVVGICFPGMYASLRDRPFLDDILARLRTREDEAPAAEEDASVLEGISTRFRSLYSGEEAAAPPGGERQ